MKRVVITGASGFVGRASVRALAARGFDVVATARGPAPVDDPTVRWRQLDLLTPGAAAQLFDAERPTHLLHVAWLSSTSGEVMTSPANADWLSASLELVGAFARAGGARVAVVGSCAEYDWTYGLCRAGLTPHAPASLYGACKHALRVALEPLAQHAGLSLVWPRAFFVYGPRERKERLAASVIAALLDARPAPLTHGRQIRDFLHVDDLAEGLAASLDSHVTGAIDIVSGEPLALRDLAQEIARQIGRPDLLRLDALPARPDEPKVILGDGAPARRLLSWSPRFTLQTGLADTIAAARATRHG
jgi:nucleoside-diphosphate-sugar epimerase